MRIEKKTATPLGWSILVLAVALAGCHSDGPPPAGDVHAGYYPGKMVPRVREHFDEGAGHGGRPRTGAPNGSRGMRG